MPPKTVNEKGRVRPSENDELKNDIDAQGGGVS
jgi:hypothetical protein